MDGADPLYVPLWCKSSFSFLDGASDPQELIEAAHRHRLPAIAIADRDGVYGLVRAHVKAAELGVKLILGATLTVAARGTLLPASPVSGARSAGLHAADDEVNGVAPVTVARRGRTRGRRRAMKNPSLPLSSSGAVAATGATSIVLLVMNRGGWTNLTRLITAGRRRQAKGDSLVGWDEVAAMSTGLIALWGGEGSLVAEGQDADVESVGALLHGAFGDRLYAMVTRHRRAEDVPMEVRIRARATLLGVPVVAAGEVLYHAPSRRPLHDVLTCIRHGVTLTNAGRRLRANDEYDLKTSTAFAQVWTDDRAAMAQTLSIADRCQFSLSEIRYRYPLEKLPGGISSNQHLRELTWAGARGRYGGEVPLDVAAQLNHELELIEELDYGGYFLTMHEIVGFCRSHGILCQGRGSAANSAVCYCLGITAVDPVRMGLLFERFLSRERAEPPDIDLDIEHERREEVIQHVYRTYGRDHSAMVCNIIRYRPKSAVRDVGKVLGLPETALDRVAKRLSSWGDLENAEIEAALSDSAHPGVIKHLIRLASEILDVPRHLSIHPGGFVLGHEPVHDLVPIENATMPGRTVIQWDKDDLDHLGLFKVDLLGLGALHQVHRCFDLIREHRGVELSMASIPVDDPETYQMMCAADTVGVFQIESRAQMSMLPRLRPEKFYDLVIEVSIVRPGPITGGMVHPYLRRRRGEEAVEYPHPCLEPVLARTLGVPLFQEQVMRLAVVAADYTPGEADQLRRDMAAWRRSGRIEQHRERLVERMTAKGIAQEFAERVFEQIRGFGEYGFPESHAASFALIAYTTAYLRRHYLAEFTCGLLNAMPMGFYSPATVVGDAQRHGLDVRAIDVTASDWDCTLEAMSPREFAVRMGLRYVKGLSLADGQRIAHVRRERPFVSLDDLVRRTRLAERTYSALAETGALGALVPARRDALWQVQGWARRQDDALDLGGEVDAIQFSALSRFESIAWDYQASAHSTRGHLLTPFRRWFRDRHWLDAGVVQRGNDGARIDYVGIVICRQRPYTAAGVTFMTLEDEAGFVNVVIWKQVYEQYAVTCKTATVLGVSGRLQVQEGVVHLVAESLWIPELPMSIRAPGSRDFH